MFELCLGWFAAPLTHGDYPASMRERLGERLPTFSDEDRARIQGSADFFGLNHYSTLLATRNVGAGDADPLQNGGLAVDQDVTLSADLVGPTTAMGWPAGPWGFRKMLAWIDARYDHPRIIVTEDGRASDDEIVEDALRIEYLRGYLDAAHDALADGVDLGGHFVWSLLDNFEWAHGYSKQFGLHHVDFSTGARTPKASAAWYREVVRRNALPGPAPRIAPGELRAPGSGA